MQINVECEGGSEACEGRYWGEWFTFIAEPGFVLPHACSGCLLDQDLRLSEYRNEQDKKRRIEAEKRKDLLRSAHSSKPNFTVFVEE